MFFNFMVFLSLYFPPNLIIGLENIDKFMTTYTYNRLYTCIHMYMCVCVYYMHICYMHRFTYHIYNIYMCEISIYIYM